MDFVNFGPPLRRDRVGELYAKRTAIALKIKWRKMSSDYMFWVSALTFARIIHQYGEQGEGDKIKAHRIFRKRRGGKVFEYEDVYKIVQGSHKWKLDIAQPGVLAGKRARLGENTPNTVKLEKVAEEEESEGGRPIGRNSTKRKRRRKMHTLRRTWRCSHKRRPQLRRTRRKSKRRS